MYKNPSLLYPSPQYGASNSSIPGFNFDTGPLSVDDATACDVWNFKDRRTDTEYKAQYVQSIAQDKGFYCSSYSYPFAP